MKKGPAIILILSLLVSIISGCKWNTNNANGNDPTSQTDTTPGEKQFESEARVYESPDRVIWQKPDLVVDQLGDVDGKVIADLGAGTGYFSRRIAYKGGTVIAIDIDPDAIQWMKEQKARFPPELQERLIIRQASADDPQLSENEVDMVLLVNTYSYITNRVAYFAKLKNAIRPRGTVVIIDFKKKETPFGPPVDERIDINTVMNEMKEAGYTPLHTDEESLEYQYIVKVRSD